ncbi:MAG TPA: MFS transporter [Acidobacteriaceae bacterium]|nr:MFS transporter [Acidobacteriaceae bacterium]
MKKRFRLFYGWLIVFVCALGLFVGAPLMVFSFSVFFKSLTADFHAGRAAVSFAFSLFNTVGALWLPGTGILIDRFGAKRVIVVSTLVYGLALCSALLVGTGLWQLYLLFTILGAAMASGPSPVSPGVVISHWFDRRRGLALGLAMMGIGVGAVLVPIVAERLSAQFGWRTMFAIFGGATLLAPLPITAALLKNDPKERGLRPDGDQATPALRAPRADKTGLSWQEVWHSKTFWIMICIFSLAGLSVHGAVLHIFSIFTDRGISAERAALVTSLVGAAVMVGRLGSGILLDHVFAPRVAMLFYCAAALGMGILAAGSRGNIAFAAAFLVGLGMGAEVETMGYMISRYFGLRAFGTAYGHAFAAFMIAGAAGVTLMGAGYDRFHSYAVPLTGYCGAMILVLILLTRLGPYEFGAEPEKHFPMEPAQLPSES